jgi:hypothetical protein
MPNSPRQSPVLNGRPTVESEIENIINGPPTEAEAESEIDFRQGEEPKVQFSSLKPELSHSPD